MIAPEQSVWRFETTGKMVGNGAYEISFVRTRGTHPLRLDTLVYYKQGEKLVEIPLQGKVDATRPVLTCRLEVKEFEAGLPFYMEVKTQPEGGNDTFGFVFVKKVEE